MDTFETDVNLFSKQHAGDETLFVVFYMGIIKNESRSTEEGRAIFDDVECVRIIVPGDKNSVIDRPAQVSDKQRFLRQYELFKKGVAEEDQVSGTRLTDWPFLSRAQCEELRYLGIKTVEQLASVRDDITTKVPGVVTPSTDADGRRLMRGNRSRMTLQRVQRAARQQNAGVWLAKATKSAEAAQFTKQMQEQAAALENLQSVVKEQAARIEKLLTAQKA